MPLKVTQKCRVSVLCSEWNSLLHTSCETAHIIQQQALKTEVFYIVIIYAASLIPRMLK